MIISKLTTKTTRRLLCCCYFTGNLFAARPCSSSATPTEKIDPSAHLQNTVSKICDVIRRQPRWESSLLSILPPPASVIFHPSCINLVIRRLSDSNPLLSFRYLQWLSSSSFPFSLDTETAASFLNALAASRAWSLALHAIRSMKCLNELTALDPFVFLLCGDARSLHRNANLLPDLCDILESRSLKLSLASWNSALSASLRTERTDLFRRFFTAMIEAGTAPDTFTAGHLIRALCHDGDPANAYHVLRHVSRKGIMPDAVSITPLISSFSKAGNFGRVSEILHLMIAGGSQPDLFTYQEIIHALCGIGGSMVDEALRIFRDLKLKGYACDVVTYTTMIDGLCKAGRMEAARLLWSEMSAIGIRSNHYTYNAVIHGYCKAGDIDRARELCDEMVTKGFQESTVSCNTMLVGLCTAGRLDDAIDLFDEMPNRGIERDAITYNTLIQSLCRLGKTSDAIRLYSRLLEAGIQPTISTYTPLIGALCTAGRASEATELMKTMEARGLEPLVCTNDFIIAGFCTAGEWEKAMEWLSKMLQRKMKPGEETMNRLVECLCSLERVDEALQMVKLLLRMSYRLGLSVCDLLVGKLCAVDYHEIGLRMDEVTGIER